MNVNLTVRLTVHQSDIESTFYYWKITQMDNFQGRSVELIPVCLLKGF
jgi:hypothetical protein